MILSVEPGVVKVCRDCGETKPESDYYRLRGRYLYSRCKPCHYIRTQAWRANNRDKLRALERARYHAGDGERKKDEKRLAKYGITRAQYDAMFESQDHRCPICEQPFAPPSSTDLMAPVVDHDHDTGKVRGILHRKCNIGLAFMFTDDESRRAADYLRGRVMERAA